MNKYYHFTNEECFYSIMRNGLIPQNGLRSQSIGDSQCGVFLSKGIPGTITMYASMLSYYEKYNGPEGDKIIAENLDNIDRIKQYKYYYMSKQQCDKEIECNYIEIQRVNQIKNCRSFFEYLGGNGCFLSVDGLNVDEKYPENCCYNDIIPPSNIKVVNIRNKNIYINDLTYLREIVLAYFMYYYPLENLLKYVQNDYKTSIINLYNNRSKYAPLCYNPNNYYIEEIPIIDYDYDKQKVKTLI